MRPLGQVAVALLRAAQEPGTVREVCMRAQVGVAVGRYTASRLVERGALVVVSAGRPVIVKAASVEAMTLRDKRERPASGPLMLPVFMGAPMRRVKER